MSWANRHSGISGRLDRHVGESIEFRVPHDLTDQDSGFVTELRTKAHYPAGAVALALELPGGVTLTGSVEAGLDLTVGGATYRTTARAAAAGNELKVDITPGLVSALGADEPVSVASFSAVPIASCRVSKPDGQKSGQGGEGQRQVRIPRTSITFQPAKGWYAIVEGVEGEITSSRRESDHYVILVGGADA